MLEKLLEWGSKVVLWAESKPNRLRMRGARIEVLAMVISQAPSPQVLLGESRYGVWMLPQEGVMLKEALPDALARCLREECKVDVPDDPVQRRRLFYLHSIRYLDTLDLPQSRVGERSVADDAPGTAFESIELKRKAYWLAILLVGHPEHFPAKPDGVELTKLNWFPLAQARGILERTNDAPKAALLTLCIDHATKFLRDTRHVSVSTRA
jgi:ADP-ribose pyrophosphatase YjhB (NUDIX family)